MRKQKNRPTVSRSLSAGALRRLAVCALLAAVSIVCGKYLAFNAGPVLRFSFENLPILMAAVFFGPLWGGAVGVIADLLGCVLVGYTVNPLVTLGAATLALVGGVAWMLLRRLPLALRTGLTVALAHLCGSVLVKTPGLAAFYGMPFWMLLLWRLLNYAIVGVLEFFVLYFMLKNKAVGKLLDRM